MFGHCLWWVIPKNHSWVRNVRTLFGKVSHPLHVTIATHVDERATDPRVPTRMHSLSKPSQDNFPRWNYRYTSMKIRQDTIYRFYIPRENHLTCCRPAKRNKPTGWSEPYTVRECVDCSGHFSTWKVD